MTTYSCSPPCCSPCSRAEGPWPLAVVVAGVVLIALDPLVEICTHFLMGDFLACATFFIALAAAISAYRSHTRSLWPATALSVLSIVAAVLMAVILRMVIELTFLITFALLGAAARGQIAVISCVLAAAPLALGLQAAANRVVFARAYPHETFVMQQSGVFLAGPWRGTISPCRGADHPAGI